MATRSCGEQRVFRARHRRRGRRQEDEAAPPAVPRRNSRRQRKSALAPSPLRICKEHVAQPGTFEPSVSVEREDDGVGNRADEDADHDAKGFGANGYVQDVQDIMDQFMGVGGLREPAAGAAQVR